MRKIYTLLASVLVFLACSTAAGAESMQDHYYTISPAQPLGSRDRAEVVEVFWYGCPHCYAFEPQLQKWLENKPDQVDFKLLPGVLSAGWIPHARAFFTAVRLDVLDDIHHQLFDAIHKDKRQIYDEASIREFFIEQGVDGDEFTRVYHSLEINSLVRQAFELEKHFRISRVPSIIINGKYVTSPSMAGSYENLLKLIDYLADK